MFDNIIFASFVPQMLMLLGYLSCLFLPVHFRSEQQPAEFIQLTEYTQSNPQSAVYNISFLEVIQEIEEIDFHKQLYLHHFTVSDVYFPHLFFETSDNLYFRLFSRPPPEFC